MKNLMMKDSLYDYAKEYKFTLDRIIEYKMKNRVCNRNVRDRHHEKNVAGPTRKKICYTITKDCN